MTGEITLRGRVLPIGGLKEKLLAALRGGLKTVMIPKENEKDLAEIPDNVKTRAGRSSRSPMSTRCCASPWSACRTRCPRARTRRRRRW